MLTTTGRTLAAALLAVAALTGACGGTPGALPDGHVALEGRLLDADTGQPVSRRTVWMHFFCDELGVQESLPQVEEPGYHVVLPGRTVRVRVYDAERTYHLFEETIEVAGDGRTYDVLLAPTGYVRLHGRVLLAATGRPVTRHRVDSGAIGDHGPLLYFSSGGRALHTGAVSLDADGGYSLRVPRARIEIGAVDTSLSLVPENVDLTGHEGAEFELDLRLQ